MIKFKSSKKYLFLFIIMILGFTFIACGGNGGGNGNGDGDDPPRTFTTSRLFPLTSGWETDRWTLFVDVSDHDVNGTTVKAMVDTREPKVLYWTNDDNGLRLHGEMDDDGDTVVFSAPIVFAGSTCKVGDKKEGTVTINLEEFNYSVEIAAVEDVTVPAGTFQDCPKITLLVYPSGDSPSNYGYETLWFAEDVGFVKAQADANSDSDLFVDAGETRQLLSYHITDPAGLSADEQAVRDAYIQWNDYFNARNLNSVMSMISDDLLNEFCLDKDDLENIYSDYFNDISDNYFFMTIEDISLNGDMAYVLREGLDSYTNDATGDKEWDWSRVLRSFRRENGEWKYYGAQLGFNPSWYDVYVRNTFYDGQKYPIGAEFTDCEDGELIDDTDPISTFTISGPPGSGLDNLDLIPYWDDEDSSGWRGFWNNQSLTVGVSGFYTYRVENLEGDYFVFTDYLEAAPHLDLAVQVSPVDGAVVDDGQVILNWNEVNQADTYRVDMQYSDDGGTTWQGMPNIYTDDTQATITANADTRYQWRVRARTYDNYGELGNESRSDWLDFATDEFFTMGGYLQYRTYSNADNNQYRTWLGFTKNGAPIQQSDITDIILEDSSSTEVSFNSPNFYASDYFWGEWNESTSSVDFSGPHAYSGFSISFPDETSLSEDDYTYEATTSQGDTLTLTIDFPGGEPPSPVVDLANMSYLWNGDGSLSVAWSIPDGTFDEFRIVFLDQDGDDLLSVRMPSDSTELTIPSGWIQQITDHKNPSATNWEIQTRLTDNDNNYARGYSGTVEIPWNP